MSSPGRFLIGWGSFLEGESLLSKDERKEKMDEDIRGHEVCQHHCGRRGRIRTTTAYFCFLS